MSIIIVEDDDTFYKDSHLQTLEFTDLLRLASLNDSASDYLKRTRNMRGVPINDSYSLFDYQIEALDWMKTREQKQQHGIIGGIICMEMGMGKTLVGLIHTLSHPKGDGPTIIVASKTVMIEWKTQGVDKFLKYSNVLYLHPDFMSKSDISILTVDKLKQYDIVITTYDICISATKLTNVHDECFEYGDEHSLMKGKVVSIGLRKNTSITRLKNTIGIGSIYGLVWERIICDESQRFANFNTKVYHSVMAICANYRWCLSGTPIRNYDTDIWSQLRFCGYKKIDRAPEWRKCGRVQFAADNLEKALYVATYTEAGINLPKKTEIDVLVEISEEQRIVYSRFLNRLQRIYKSMMEGQVDFVHVMCNFVRLRQCAISPYLMCKESKRTSIAKSNTDPEDLEMASWKETEMGIYSPKITKIVDIIKEIPQTEKACFFTTFTSYSDLLTAALDKLLPDCKYLQLDGDTVDRQKILDTFRSDPSIRVLLLTYKVGGEGLNLVEATHCIFGEPWWSNAVLRQAKARVWRSGQTKPVFIYNVISVSTIEERILEICKEKDNMAGIYLNDSRVNVKEMGLTKNMMGRILNMA
jgi:SNF2 family DNA or RNA helicase